MQNAVGAAPVAPGREILKAKLVVVGVDSVDSKPSLMLVCDDMSYLFNCGEGTQRLCEEYRIKLPKLGHIFFSHVDWRMVGGFPGLVLTMSDIGGEELGVHGPPGTLGFVASLRYFVKRPDLALRVSAPGSTFADANIAVRQFLVTSLEEKLQEQDVVVEAVETGVGWTQPNQEDGSVTIGLGKKRLDGAAAKSMKQQKKFANPEELLPDGGGFRDAPEDARPMPRLVPPTSPKRVVACFEVKLADVRGKFDVERAKALGVKPGKLFSDLIRGVIVKSETGEEVTPQQCLGPNVPGPVVLLIDCPDASYALSLFSLTDLQVSLSRADFVCHLGDSAVVSSSEYAAWLGKFCSDKVQHVLLNASCSQQPLFRSAALVQEALARVASVFSEHSQSPRAQAPSPVWPHRCASVGESLTLAPPKLAGFTPCPSRAPLPVSEQLQGEPVREAAWLDQTMEFGFLGTGASRPSKYRNVTCQYIVRDNRVTFLDCGEGSLGQFLRLHGQRGDPLMNQLSCIAISHLHADHHLGITSLLMRSLNATVLAPAPLLFWAAEMREWHAAPLGVGWTESWHDLGQPLPPQLAERLGMQSLLQVPVVHCPMSFGFVLDWSNFRLVYSGDTRPCELLEELGRDADLLIHEATFEDCMQEDAVMKRHSTVGEAVLSSSAMRAKHVLLTHFSQRYPKAVGAEGHGHVAMAWDFLRFQPQHLPQLPYLSSFARQVFPEQEDE